MRIQDGATLLFTGDSITDCGRARPVGIGGGLGDGYVSIVNGLLSAFYPERAVRVLNTAISGNRVTDLEARWSTDTLALAPTWLSVMIGINDVWRQFDNPMDSNQVPIGRYEDAYRAILEQVRPSLDGLVLMSPFYLEVNPADPMRERMDAYGGVVERLARDLDALFVDVQASFNRHLAYRPTQELCGDRVHPNRVGHVILARAFLEGVGFDWGKPS